ncbi:MAG: tetratricopeptide repeat protein [Planctomycetota bacterium]
MASGGQLAALGLTALIAGGAGAVVATQLVPPGTPAPADGLAGELGGPTAELEDLRRRVAALEERGEHLPALPGPGVGADGGGPPSAAEAANGDSGSTSAPGPDRGASDSTSSRASGGNAGGTSGAGTGAGRVDVRAGGRGKQLTPMQRMEQTLKTLRQRVKRIEDASDNVDVSDLTPDEMAQRAGEAWEAKQWKKGARLYRELLKRDPDHPRAGEARWEIGSRAADNEEGIQLLEQFIEKDESHSWHPYARYYLGRRYNTAENPSRAEQEFRQALETSDENPYFGIMNRWELAQLADARNDKASGDQHCREALQKHGSCTWGSVQGVLKQMRARLGIPDPQPKKQ